MQSHRTRRFLAIPALALIATAAVPSPAAVAVDGWTFTSTTRSTERGAPETIMQVQVAGAMMRVDWQKAAAGMPQGSYMILDGEAGRLTMVSPKERTATILPLGGMASMLGALGASGMMKMEVTDIVVSTTDGGAGEPMLGFPTRKYTMKQAYAMKMSVGPIKRSSTVDNTTELWVADVPVPEQKAFEAFSKNFSQNFTSAGFGGEGMKTLLDEVAAKLPKGVALKSVSTSITDQGGRKSTTTTTTEVTEFRKVSIDEKVVFTIPADYKVTDMSATNKG